MRSSLTIVVAGLVIFSDQAKYENIFTDIEKWEDRLEAFNLITLVHIRSVLCSSLSLPLPLAPINPIEFVFHSWKTVQYDVFSIVVRRTRESAKKNFSPFASRERENRPAKKEREKQYYITQLLS
jgi:hypothetical protein